MGSIREIIVNAGKVLKERYFASFTYNEKGRYDLVSEVDLEIEEILISNLKSIDPSISFYSEECGEVGNQQEKRWIIDPVDGTANFIFGIPYFNISVCQEQNNQIVEAYIYNPISDEMYHSTESEKVSFLNDRLIHVSGVSEVRNSLIAFGFSVNIQNINRYYQEWPLLFTESKKGMGLLSPALNICNVARGRIDCFIDFGSSMEGHAGAALILKNAGGIVINYDMTDWNHKTKGCIVTNKDLFVKVKESRKING